jgi:hypothetical protein
LRSRCSGARAPAGRRSPARFSRTFRTRPARRTRWSSASAATGVSGPASSVTPTSRRGTAA